MASAASRAGWTKFSLPDLPATVRQGSHPSARPRVAPEACRRACLNRSASRTNCHQLPLWERPLSKTRTALVDLQRPISHYESARGLRTRPVVWYDLPVRKIAVARARRRPFEHFGRGARQSPFKRPLTPILPPIASKGSPHTPDPARSKSRDFNAPRASRMPPRTSRRSIGRARV